MRTSTRGFTLLEVVIALTLLVTVLAASWTLLSSAQRNEHFMWDEFAAVSQLERVCAREKLDATPTSGSALSADLHDSKLPELTVTLFVTAAADRADLQDVRVAVAWLDASTHAPRSLERTARRRVSP